MLILKDLDSLKRVDFELIHSFLSRISRVSRVTLVELREGAPQDRGLSSRQAEAIPDCSIQRRTSVFVGSAKRRRMPTGTRCCSDGLV